MKRDRTRETGPGAQVLSSIHSAGAQIAGGGTEFEMDPDTSRIGQLLDEAIERGRPECEWKRPVLRSLFGTTVHDQFESNRH